MEGMPERHNASLPRWPPCGKKIRVLLPNTSIAIEACHAGDALVSTSKIEENDAMTILRNTRPFAFAFRHASPAVLAGFSAWRRHRAGRADLRGLSRSQLDTSIYRPFSLRRRIVSAT